ncbi:MAG: TGS domain-containing protein [Gemmatimonadota bacterium]|nr:TGS domain-containing protein [Gemmatimonadota bacterium]
MPANLTPAYREAEARFRSAVTREEKIAGLEEMLRVIPRHKGTEKLQADLRTRLSKLKREPKKKGPKSHSHKIPREGAGQVVLVGPPNAGKSSLVAALTHATPAVADYPLTTREATPGMMPYEDIAVQLVDLPPLCEEHVEPWVYDLVRGSDLVWLVISIAHPLVGLELTTELLAGKAVGLFPAGREAPDDGRAGWRYRPALLVVTGMDRAGSAADLDALRDLLDIPWPTVPVSCVTRSGLDALGTRTFDALQIIRVYTKEPKEDPDRDRPFTLPRGTTVGDLARTIHKDVAASMKFARVWGPSAFDGQSVHAAHVLEEGDVVEIHF